MQRSSRASSSAREYLERHQIEFYLRDVVTLLLKARDDRPLDFISEYFADVMNGTGVLLREYAHVNRNTRNRWSFVQSAREALGELDQAQLLAAPAFMQLLRLVCPDFPAELAKEACRLCGGEDGTHPLSRLLHAACVRLCYADFLQRVADVFRGCDTQSSGRIDQSVIGLALRQAAQARTSGTGMPSPEVFDMLIGAGSDVSLNEVQQLLVHSPAMTRFFDPPASEMSMALGARAAGSPSGPGAGGSAISRDAPVESRRAGFRSTRERLEAAACAASAAAAGATGRPATADSTRRHACGAHARRAGGGARNPAQASISRLASAVATATPR